MTQHNRVASALLALAIIAWSGVVRGVEPTRLERPKELTPMSEVQLLHVLRDAHLDVFGKPASPRRLANAWAQVALENSKGRQMWNYNIGNVGPGYNMNHEYYKHSWKTNYRAFDGYYDGAVAYWQTIKRCSSALRAFDDGNPEAAAHALKRCNYYGADVDLYVNGMKTLFWHAYSRVVPAEKEEAHSVSRD